MKYYRHVPGLLLALLLVSPSACGDDPHGASDSFIVDGSTRESGAPDASAREQRGTDLPRPSDSLPGDAATEGTPPSDARPPSDSAPPPDTTPWPDGAPPHDTTPPHDATPTPDVAPKHGRVDFVAIYEKGSAWQNNTTAQKMVDSVFADFEAHLRTSGPWNTTIAVYLTDNDTGYAHVTFKGTFSDATYRGQIVRVVPAWRKLVLGGADPNGPAKADGTGTEFSVHFNLTKPSQATNAGLLRHELMHGLGAVNSLKGFTATDGGTLTGPMPGDRVKAALYDLQLVDLKGKALLGAYRASDHTFAVQHYTIETKLADWKDGDGGVFFRGLPPGGGVFDMACMTFPISATTGRIDLKEPRDLMSASAHKPWAPIGKADLAFFHAMGYTFVP